MVIPLLPASSHPEPKIVVQATVKATATTASQAQPFMPPEYSSKRTTSTIAARFLMLLVAAVSLSACVRRESLEILPATLEASPSAVNRVDGNTIALAMNVALSGRLKFRSVSRWGLRIDARAEAGADGRWPQLRVEVDGVRHTIVVNDRRSIPYWVNFAVEPGLTDLSLSLLNGAPGERGPTLTIERVQVVPL